MIKTIYMKRMKTEVISTKIVLQSKRHDRRWKDENEVRIACDNYVEGYIYLSLYFSTYMTKKIIICFNI